MPANVMSFDSQAPIGRVMSVDTMRVFVHIDDHELLKKVGLRAFVWVIVGGFPS